MGEPELHHMSSREWGRDATMRMYTPLLAADVAALYTLAQYIEQLGNVPRSLVHEAARSTPFFFASHPIQYVQVAGYVVAPTLRSAFPSCTFEIHDGMSEQRCSCVFAEPAPLEEGQFVCVLGEVSYFHEPQVNARKIYWYENTLARAFMFKQEALDVRRFVLEQPVDALKPYSHVWSGVRGHPVLTDFIDGLSEPPPAFARIRRSLTTKARTWGFKSMREHATACVGSAGINTGHGLAPHEGLLGGAHSHRAQRK